MTHKRAYVSPEALKIEIGNVDVVTDSGLETPSITFPLPTAGKTPGAEN